MTKTRREQHDRWLAASAVTLSSALVFFACGGSSEPPSQAPHQKDVKLSGVSADDQSRCDYKGRADRESSEVSGPGSVSYNIRRVFALSGEGEERKRILICREVDTNLDGVKDVVRTYNERGEALNETADTDFDGKIDRWQYYSAKGVIEKEGSSRKGAAQPDTWQYYSAKGVVEKEGFSQKGTAQPDTWQYFDAKGAVVRREIDENGDGKIERWQTWSGGRVVSEELDSDGDGIGDRRLRYGPGGRLLGMDKLPARAGATSR